MEKKERLGLGRVDPREHGGSAEDAGRSCSAAFKCGVEMGLVLLSCNNEKLLTLIRT